MPAISGYQCDGPKCEVMADQNPPKSWMRLTVPARIPVMDQGSGRTEDREATWYFCSNKCLSRQGKARYDAAVEAGLEVRPGRRGGKRGDA